MQYKIALEMIQEVVQRKDDDEQTTADGDKEEEEVVEKPDVKLIADEILRESKR